MADEPHVTGLGEPTTKDKIKLPLWLWVVVGTVALAGGYLWYRNRQQNAANAASGNQTTPVATAPGYVDPTTILPMFQGGQPATPTATGNGDVYGTSGQDLGQYLYGGAQLAYLNQNIGQFGLTQSEVDDVQQAYNQVSGLHGSTAANLMHYSWISPGNVQAIPQNLLAADQIIQGLP